jgi:hypothetical protein
MLVITKVLEIIFRVTGQFDEKVQRYLLFRVSVGSHYLLCSCDGKRPSLGERLQLTIKELAKIIRFWNKKNLF